MSKLSAGMRPRKPGQRSGPSEDKVRELTQKAEHIASKIPGQGGQAPARSDVQTLERPGMVERKGRVLADGSRRGARTLRRITVYLPPELAQALDVKAAQTGRQKSEILAEALAAHLSNT